jgi:hypothetical protein
MQGRLWPVTGCHAEDDDDDDDDDDRLHIILFTLIETNLYYLHSLLVVSA